LQKGAEVAQGPAGPTDALHRHHKYKSLRLALQNNHQNNQKPKAHYQRVASFVEISIQSQKKKEPHNNSSKELLNTMNSKQRN